MLLADRPWWDRWLPRLNQLLGPELSPPRYGARLGEPEFGPILDSNGYRHVTVALCAVEAASGREATANLRILTVDQIRNSWVQTLLNLVGEGEQILPTGRLGL